TPANSEAKTDSRSGGIGQSNTCQCLKMTEEGSFSATRQHLGCWMIEYSMLDAEFMKRTCPTVQYLYTCETSNSNYGVVMHVGVGRLYIVTQTSYTSELIATTEWIPNGNNVYMHDG